MLYCDRCNKRGPEAAYDNAEDVMDQADKLHWVLDSEEDICPECVSIEAAKPQPKTTKKRGR